MTIAVWIQSSDASKFRQNIYNDSGSDTLGLSIASYDFVTGHARFSIRDVSDFEDVERGVNSTTPVTDGEWHHIAGVLHGNGEIEIYVDGVSEDTNSFGYTPDISSLAGGAVPVISMGSEYFNGMIDDLRIYNRALSPDDIYMLAAPPQSLSFSPSFGQTQIDEMLDVTLELAAPAPPGGLAVILIFDYNRKIELFQADGMTVIRNWTTVTVPADGQEYPMKVKGTGLTGLTTPAWLLATAEGWATATAEYLVVAPPEPLMFDPAGDAFSFPLDPGPHTQTISLPEGVTAVVNVALVLTYDETVINVAGITSGGAAIIPGGQTGVALNVSAVAIGSTELRAEGGGYEGAAGYTVTGELLLSIASSADPDMQIAPGTPLVLDDEYILTASVSPPVAADSSLALTIEYNDAYMTVAQPAIIEGGNDSAELHLTADAATVAKGVWGSPVAVTASAPSGYAPASADYHIGFILGDVSDDNCVNVLDILAVRANLGKEGSEIDPMSTDINGDGKVNVLDLLGVRANLGKGNGCTQ